MSTVGTDITKRIEAVIDDLLSPDVNLELALRKAKVIAYSLKNNRLKAWVESELTGYRSEPVPDYRVVHGSPKAHVVQPQPFGGATQWNNIPLTTDHLPADIRKSLTEYRLTQPVAELQHLADGDGHPRVEMNGFTASYLTKQCLDNGFRILSGWFEVSNSSFHGVLSAIREHLNTMMLELLDASGDINQLELLKGQQRISSIVTSTVGGVGTINAAIVNLNQGDTASQSVDLGDVSDNAVQQGNGSSLVKKTFDSSALLELLREIRLQAQVFGDDPTVAEIIAATVKAEKEASKTPLSIATLNVALSTVYQLLLGSAATLFTPGVQQGLAHFIALLGATSG